MPEETLKRLGNIFTGKVERDAVHIAVAPVMAGENLKPGDHVNFSNGKAFKKGSKERLYYTVVNSVGIVDPYLTKDVKAGEQFYLFLYPGSITSLRHEWTHPSFNTLDDIAVRGESEAYLANVAKEAGLSFSELLEGAEDYIKNDNYLCEGGRWEGFSIGANFWEHYTKVTGQDVSNKKYLGSFFSCSC